MDNFDLALTQIEVCELIHLLEDRRFYLFKRLRDPARTVIFKKHPDWKDLLQKELDVLDSILDKL